MKLFYAINNLLSSRNEHFSSYPNNKEHKSNTTLIVSFILSMIIYLALILLVGKWIWNNVLVKLVSGVNKIKNPVDLLWLHILFSLLFGTL